MARMKAALYTQKKDLDTFLYLSKFITELEKYGVGVTLHDVMVQNLNFSKEFQTFSCKEELRRQQVDFFFSFGGDGTILNALLFIEDLDVAVVGVNTGRLGFLSSFTKDEVFNELGTILNREYTLSKRSVIQIVEPNSGFFFPYALNDICISRKETTAMITVESFLNDEFLNVFWGDGLIISTPTGSTAYNLSCGGPIIAPQNDNFVITPIAPHNLNVRPLIVKDDVTIRLKIQSRVPQYTLAMDSRLYHMGTETELVLRKAKFQLSLVQPKNLSFYDTIRQKLLWGNDKRN